MARPESRCQRLTAGDLGTSGGMLAASFWDLCAESRGNRRPGIHRARALRPEGRRPS
jgi:hypothetical protein